jgi:excisionase family DNA binding protein
MSTLSKEEAADLLKCSIQTLDAELASGRLPSVKLGRERVIPREAFFQRLNEIALEESKLLRKPAPLPPSGTRRRPLPQIPG